MCGIWAIFGDGGNSCEKCASCMRIAYRGPDRFRIESVQQYRNCYLGFHRLAIMDQEYGMQPMRMWDMPHIWLLYNGEIYNSNLVGKEFGFQYHTQCDGESILHLYHRGGIEFAVKHLDGVFAFCLVDEDRQKVYIGRDLYGVRPLFRSNNIDGVLALCSEAKGIIDVVRKGSVIEAFPPGTVETYNLNDKGFVSLTKTIRYQEIGGIPFYKTIDSIDVNEDIYEQIRTTLTASVSKRLMAQRRIGCLLSGGLDSSLISALTLKLLKKEDISYKVQTFSIGMQGSPDLKAARQVAEFIDSEHHEVLFTPEEGIEVIDDVIAHLESYDITTIRASVGMYLLAKYIKKNTNTVVILSGEGADEVGQGYIYFHKAPNPEEADLESRRLLSDLYLFDNLRADRITAGNGLELRVPFLDPKFVSLYLAIDPSLRTAYAHGMEKYLIRKAFSDMNLLPDNILWRPKEAFSDGISNAKKSWFQILQDYFSTKVTDGELETASHTYPMNTPHTKEAYYYRRQFEKTMTGQHSFIPYIWMPKWQAANVTDPSARVLNFYDKTMEGEVVEK